jgi:peroxiredoxin Q/BCP
MTPKKKTSSEEQKNLLQVGDKAPLIDGLLDDRGETFSFTDFHEQLSRPKQPKAFVLFFYPKDLTSGCTQEACDFRDAWDQFQKLGLPVMGVSKDSIKSHQKFRDKYELPFRLLSDPEGKLCQAFGVWKEKSMYGRKYMGIERSTFIVSGADSRVLAAFRGVKVPGHVEAVWEALSSLGLT